MNKLKLDLDSLAVDAFDTMPGQPEEKGTVVGNNHTRFNTDCECVNTMDPRQFICYSYAVQCPASYVPTNCHTVETAYDQGCRDSITACGD